MPLPQHNQIFKIFIHDIICPVLESAREIRDAKTFAELISQLNSYETLACSFVQNGMPEIIWEIDEVRWFELSSQSDFQVIQQFCWLAVPASVIEAIEN